MHRATLLDGTRVVVKVQRPDAEGLILADLALLQLFARHAGRRKGLTELLDVEAVFAHLDTSLRRELDFTQEAANVAAHRAVAGRRTRDSRCRRCTTSSRPPGCW